MNQDEKIILNAREAQELLALLEEFEKALEEADAILAELNASEAQQHSVIEAPITRQMYFQDEEDGAELLPSYPVPKRPRMQTVEQDAAPTSPPRSSHKQIPGGVQQLREKSVTKPNTAPTTNTTQRTLTDILSEFACTANKPSITPNDSISKPLTSFFDDDDDMIAPAAHDINLRPTLLPELHFEPTRLITPDGALIYQDKVQTSKLKASACQTPSALAKHDDFKPIRRNQKGPKVLHVKQEKRTKVQRNKDEEIQYINELQDMYVDRLAEIIADAKQDTLKETNFTSPTGTGKTKMMSKLINKHPEWFFLVTTPSYAQLHVQISANLHKDCPGNNYCVYGVSSLTANSILQDEDILGLLPDDKKIVWIRDEGHRKSNNWKL